MQNSFIRLVAVFGMISLVPASLPAQTQPPTLAGDARLSGRQAVISSVDDFASELDGARESFLNIDGHSAAQRIRHAIAKMQERTKMPPKLVGRPSIGRWRNWSLSRRESSRRRVASVRSLDEAFARANYALAQNHLLLAIRAQNQQSRQRIGEELNSAIGHFQQGTQRLRQNIRKDEQELVQNTRHLAGNLIHGVEVTTEEIGQGIRSFGHRLEQVQSTESSAPSWSNAAPAVKR
jgi:hypothetical protein